MPRHCIVLQEPHQVRVRAHCDAAEGSHAYHFQVLRGTRLCLSKINIARYTQKKAFAGVEAAHLPFTMSHIPMIAFGSKRTFGMLHANVRMGQKRQRARCLLTSAFARLKPESR